MRSDNLVNDTVSRHYKYYRLPQHGIPLTKQHDNEVTDSILLILYITHMEVEMSLIDTKS